MGYARRDNVPERVKVAIAFLLEQKDDLAAAAEHAGMTLRELKRSMGRPQVRRYSLEQRQVALEIFCLRSPAALARVRDTSDNGMAVVAAVKAGEMLRTGVLHEEATSKARTPGLQIIVMPALQQQPTPPLLDVMPVPEAEPVPAIAPDADAE
jgi:predicted HTH domain antitoxin